MDCSCDFCWAVVEESTDMDRDCLDEEDGRDCSEIVVVIVVVTVVVVVVVVVAERGSTPFETNFA